MGFAHFNQATAFGVLGEMGKDFDSAHLIMGASICSHWGLLSLILSEALRLRD